MGIILTNLPIEFLEHLLGQEPDLDYSDDIYNEYWCINIKPFKCNNCNSLVCYATAGPHLIIIWEDKDDEDLLQLADLLMKDGRYDPHIVRYNHILGDCIDFQKALELGWLDF